MPIFEKGPEPPPRIQAISHVRIEARPGMEAVLHSFYAHLLGMMPVEGERGTVCFQTKRLQLRILLTPEALGSPMRRRLVLEIPSLDRLREQLDELQIEYEWHEGMALTERRVFVLDPAENRVELKQTWVF
jgi:hypothetical protein